MSSKKSADAAALCINFCTYYKPGKNEELACQGLIAVQRIMARGKTLSLARREHAAAPDARTIDGLKVRVCAACEFRGADCDFILTGGRADPCGGMALLMQLLGSGELSLDDIGHEGA